MAQPKKKTLQERMDLRTMYSGAVEAPPPAVDMAFGRSANRALAGMKTHGTHLVIAEIDGNQVILPTAKYVRALEEKIRVVEQANSLLEKQVRALDRNIKRILLAQEEAANSNANTNRF